MGKLIAAPGRTEITPTVQRKKAGTKPKLTELKLRLKKRVKTIVPPLGTYSLTQQWVKKSFQTKAKCLTERASMPASTVSSLPYQQTRPGFHDDFHRTLFKPKSQRKHLKADSYVLKAKNSFGSLELHGDPIELKANLAFKPQLALRDQVMNNFRELTRSIYTRWYGGA